MVLTVCCLARHVTRIRDSVHQPADARAAVKGPTASHRRYGVGLVEPPWEVVEHWTRPCEARGKIKGQLSVP